MMLIQFLDNENRPFIVTKVFLTRESAAQYAVDVLYLDYVGEEDARTEDDERCPPEWTREGVKKSLIETGEFSMLIDGETEPTTIFEIIDVGEPE